MRIGVCDDDIMQRDIVAQYIGQWGRLRGVSVEVTSFESAEAFLMYWEEEPKSFDLAVLDVQMKGMTGVELATRIRKKDKRMALIFLTGLMDGVFRGYELHALRYWSKPLSLSDCHETMDLVLEHLEKKQELLPAYAEDRRVVWLDMRDIIYLQTATYATCIHTAEQAYTYRGSLTHVAQMLNDKMFVRVSRSHIVNMTHVSVFSRTTVTMKNGERFDISYKQKEIVRSALMDYYGEGIHI